MTIFKDFLKVCKIDLKSRLKFPPSAGTLCDELNLYILWHLTIFLNQHGGVPPTGAPPLCIFFSVSKCTTFELANSLFFA